MAESATKPDPAAEASAASSGPKLAKDETEKVTSALTDEKKEAGEGDGKTLTEKATSAVKDSVFSMFGGGTKEKKEGEGEGEGDKKKDDDGEEEPSGSAKAVKEREQKEKEEKGEKGEVRFL